MFKCLKVLINVYITFISLNAAQAVHWKQSQVLFKKKPTKTPKKPIQKNQQQNSKEEMFWDRSLYI